MNGIKKETGFNPVSLTFELVKKDQLIRGY